MATIRVAVAGMATVLVRETMFIFLRAPGGKRVPGGLTDAVLLIGVTTDGVSTVLIDVFAHLLVTR